MSVKVLTQQTPLQPNYVPIPSRLYMYASHPLAGYVCCTSLTTRSSTHSYVGIWVSTHHVCNHTPTFLLPPSPFHIHLNLPNSYYKSSQPHHNVHFQLSCTLVLLLKQNCVTNKHGALVFCGSHNFLCFIHSYNDNTLYLPPPLPRTS